MNMLGISLYPDKSTFQEDQQYLEKAKQLGYKRVFMSFLQIDIKDPKRSVNRIMESAKYANALNFDVTLDIHPIVFKYVDASVEDLRYFHDMGVTTLRLDTCMDGKSEALMSQNPYHIRIELNMSNDTAYSNGIMSYQPNKTNLCGSHNFYPQGFTGLSIERFCTCSNRFQQLGLSRAAFVTSQQANRTPWPISEGLCTLEDHRYLPIETQITHMKLLDAVNDILIGNAFASDAELQLAMHAWEEAIPSLPIVCKESCSAIEKTLLFEHVQEYRGDASSYVIRSSKQRATCANISLPAQCIATNIHKGDILILNEDFGQYKGEIQIALCDREADPRINVVGHIQPSAMCLITAIKPFQKFSFREVEA